MKLKYNHEIISGIFFAIVSSFLWLSIQWMKSGCKATMQQSLTM